MNKAEKGLLIEMMANIDDVMRTLTPEQHALLDNTKKKIYGNYYALIEGVKEEVQDDTGN